MDGNEIIAILAICLCIGGAILYIIKAKKRGQKCIGCPHGGKCGSETHGGEGCHGCHGCNCGVGSCDSNDAEEE